MHRAAALLLAGCAVAQVPDGRVCGDGGWDNVHPIGILDPNSFEFHGKLAARLGWNLDQCAHCHGTDFAGGISGVSCLGCHASGPTSCTGCHGRPPASGAHSAHSPRYDCSACHVKPSWYGDAGHLVNADGTLRDRAQVTFGAIAGAGASWDGSSCANVYCHGSARPIWISGSAPCGSCHSIPPPSHARTQCSECHGRVIDARGVIISAALHVDGKVSLGDDSGTCFACHPNPGGAHASHTQARHQLAKPIGCGECHVVPASLTSPGHIDQPGPPPVFPTGSGALSRADSAQPAWNHMLAQCAGVYCHGGGTLLSSDASPTVLRTPSWIPGSGPADCGACHGLPPTNAPHTAAQTLTQCAGCHPTTMDSTGALVPGGTHLDGKVDAQ